MKFKIQMTNFNGIKTEEKKERIIAAYTEYMYVFGYL